MTPSTSAQASRTSKFGKVKTPMEEKDGAMFTRMRYEEDAGFNFHVSTRKFIGERLSPLQVHRGKAGGEACSAGDCCQAKAVLGSLNWLTHHLRADGSGRCCRLQQSLYNLTNDDVKKINQLVKHTRETADLGITVWSIPLEELMWVFRCKPAQQQQRRMTRSIRGAGHHQGCLDWHAAARQPVGVKKLSHDRGVGLDPAR